MIFVIVFVILFVLLLSIVFGGGSPEDHDHEQEQEHDQEREEGGGVRGLNPAGWGRPAYNRTLGAVSLISVRRLSVQT